MRIKYYIASGDQIINGMGGTIKSIIPKRCIFCQVNSPSRKIINGWNIFLISLYNSKISQSEYVTIYVMILVTNGFQVNILVEVSEYQEFILNQIFYTYLNVNPNTNMKPPLLRCSFVVLDLVISLNTHMEWGVRT